MTTNDTIVRIEMTGAQWNSIIMPITAVNNEVRLNFNRYDLTYGTVDTSNVMLIIGDIARGAFEEYQYNGIEDIFEIGLDLNEISDLKVKKENIVFEVVYTIKPGEYQFKVTLGTHTRYVNMLDLNAMRKTPSPPNYEDQTTYEGVMAAKDLFEVIGKLKKIGESTTIMKSGDDLNLSAKNGTSQHEYRADIVEMRNENKTFISSYDTGYLYEILKAIKDQIITIKTDTDIPLIIRYKIIPESEITFMLAPRID